MNEPLERPLISFVLIAYNQEMFIREAVEGALAQTYSPLEIVLSDDCSSDGTFEVMEQMATSYRGPHKVVLRRNLSNLGIGGHLSAALATANGSLAVMAAGDDVSFPNRTSRMAEAWAIGERRPFAVTSSVRVITADGQYAGLLSCRRTDLRLGPNFGLCGPSYALDREVWTQFGPMDNVHNEDVVLAFRSLLLGGIASIEEPLVNYRVHGNSASVQFAPESNYVSRVKNQIVGIRRRLNLIDVHLRDIESTKSVAVSVEALNTVVNRLTIEKLDFQKLLVRKLLQEKAILMNPLRQLLSLAGSGMAGLRIASLCWLVRRFTFVFSRLGALPKASDVLGCNVPADPECGPWVDLDALERLRQTHKKGVRNPV